MADLVAGQLQVRRVIVGSVVLRLPQVGLGIRDPDLLFRALVHFLLRQVLHTAPVDQLLRLSPLRHLLFTVELLLGRLARPTDVLLEVLLHHLLVLLSELPIGPFQLDRIVLLYQLYDLLVLLHLTRLVHLL